MPSRDENVTIHDDDNTDGSFSAMASLLMSDNETHETIDPFATSSATNNIQTVDPFAADTNTDSIERNDVTVDPFAPVSEANDTERKDSNDPFVISTDQITEDTPSIDPFGTNSESTAEENNGTTSQSVDPFATNNDDNNISHNDEDKDNNHDSHDHKHHSNNSDNPDIASEAADTETQVLEGSFSTDKVTLQTDTESSNSDPFAVPIESDVENHKEQEADPFAIATTETSVTSDAEHFNISDNQVDETLSSPTTLSRESFNPFG